MLIQAGKGDSPEDKVKGSPRPEATVERLRYMIKATSKHTKGLGELAGIVCSRLPWPSAISVLYAASTQVQNKDAESILGESGLAGQLKKQLAERMLAAELSHHLISEAKQGKAGNHRNGSSRKTVITPSDELNLDIPRDRQATFEPQPVAKYQHRLPGFDDHVISMYARGMSVREIQGHLLELYGLDYYRS